jgi:predicted kinase
VEIRLRNALKNNKNVILDSTNTNKKYRKSLIGLCKANDSRIIGVVFNTPYKICRERNCKREEERKIPNELFGVRKQANLYPEKSEGFDEIRYIEFEE